MFVVDFDELYLGKLFEVFRQRQGHIVERAIRLATTRQVHMGHTFRKGEFAVTGEAVEY
jgi:hypothetical protein